MGEVLQSQGRQCLGNSDNSSKELWLHWAWKSVWSSQGVWIRLLQFQGSTQTGRLQLLAGTSVHCSSSSLCFQLGCETKVPREKPPSVHLGEPLKLINTPCLSPSPQGLLKWHSLCSAAFQLHPQEDFFFFHFTALIRGPSHGPVAVGIRQMMNKKLGRRKGSKCSWKCSLHRPGWWRTSGLVTLAGREMEKGAKDKCTSPDPDIDCKILDLLGAGWGKNWNCSCSSGIEPIAWAFIFSATLNHNRNDVSDMTQALLITSCFTVSHKHTSSQWKTELFGQAEGKFLQENDSVFV